MCGDQVSTPGRFHNAPTLSLVVLGSVDKNVPFQATSDVQSWATRTVVLGGYGHEIQEELPDTFLEDLARFIQNAVAGSAQAKV